MSRSTNTNKKGIIIHKFTYNPYRESSLPSDHRTSKVKRIGGQALVRGANNLREHKQLGREILDRMLVWVTTSITNDLSSRVHFIDRVEIDGLRV